MKLSNEKKSSILLVIALIAALLFAFYYYLILPKKEEVQSLESSIASARTEISSIQKQIEEINASKTLDQATLFEMRKKCLQREVWMI